MRRQLASLLAAPVLLCAGNALAQDSYALQLFHFNVQYVAGGTIGYTIQPNPILDLDNDTIEDRIVTESLEPIIDLFEKHPTWGVDIEMQAYMLDVIAWRHPLLLDKMRTMAKSGQIDIVSFHYSDQLFIGYPAEDWERSQALTEETFAKHDVPLSRTVFCQEGQGAAAMATRLAERGYRNMVWPKNLWSYQHGDSAAEPLYRFGDALLVQGGKGANYDDGMTTIDLTWTFFDDGELLATGDINPYLPEVFVHKPEEVAEYETRLMDLEAMGVQITTVDKYVEAVQATVTPPDAPPLLDGTWQPNSTVGVARWLGGRGLFWQQERDNHVRTVGAQAHRELVAAESMFVAAELGELERGMLDSAWRMLFLGQVTDASGINPFRGEIQYGIAHMSEAMSLARRVIRDGKSKLGHASVVIDPSSGVTAGSEAPFLGESSEAPIALVIDGGDREVSEQWERVDDGHWRITIDFGPGEWTQLTATFPGELEDALAVGLALDDETPQLVERSAFTFEEFHFALPSGYIGLGGGRFAIKDMGHVHVAATVRRDAGDVVFKDETQTIDEPVRWVFHVFDGTPEQAAETAIAINVARRLVR